MKTTLLVSAFALSVLASSAAFATGSGNHMVAKFGAEILVQAGGHDMHIQAIKDKSGNEYVVMSRADAEAIMGHKLGNDVVFREFETNSR